jgi:hypothetical protein
MLGACLTHIYVLPAHLTPSSFSVEDFIISLGAKLFSCSCVSSVECACAGTVPSTLQTSSPLKFPE